LIRTQRSEVVRLEVCGLPGVVCEHLDCQVGVLYGYFLRVLRALCDGVCDNFGDGNELLLLKLREELGVVERLRVLDSLEQIAVLVLGLFGLDQDDVVAILFYPLVLETVALSDACSFLSEDFLYILSVAPMPCLLIRTHR
jgi:hypothetical protein